MTALQMLSHTTGKNLPITKPARFVSVAAGMLFDVAFVGVLRMEAILTERTNKSVVLGSQKCGVAQGLGRGRSHIIPSDHSKTTNDLPTYLLNQSRRQITCLLKLFFQVVVVGELEEFC